MSFSFSLFARQRERKVLKERENTLPRPTLSRALDKMDVASRACTLTLTIAANRCTLAARLSFEFLKVSKFFQIKKGFLKHKETFLTQ